MRSPGYEYGAMLAQLQYNLQQMMQDIARGFADAKKVLTSPIDPAQIREARSEDALERAIARERRLGLSYVDRIVKEKRKELGLSEVIPLRRGNSR